MFKFKIYIVSKLLLNRYSAVFLCCFLFLTPPIFAQTAIKICSWNLENFGKSKTDSTIDYVAKTLKTFDIVAIQEVVAGYGGAQTVAKLANALNATGAKWDYTVSNPTSSNNTYKIERYAYFWKTSKIIKTGDAWLEQKYSLEMDREPYLCTFKANNCSFTLATFHAITKAKQPETELKYFKLMPAEYPNLNLVFTGDFNCPQSHTVFNPLKTMGYRPVLQNQKTSLKQKCLGNNCLASEFDNAFFDTSKATLLQSGIIPFYLDFDNFKAARKISDHVPIYFELNFY